MTFLRDASGIATAIIALSAGAPSAVAQEITFTMACQDLGSGAPEQLGDRNGHSIVVSQVSCHVDSGPMKGGVLSGADLWEMDNANGDMISGSGVVRQPSGIAAYKTDEAKLTLTMTDGKVTGWMVSGKGRWPIATGTAAMMAGKSCTFTAQPTGAGQFAVENKCN